MILAAPFSQIPFKRSAIAVFAVILTAFLPAATLYSGDYQAADTLGREYFKQVGRDFGAVAISPGKWKVGDLLIFGVVAGTGVLLASVDEDTRTYFQDHRTPVMDDAAAIFDHFGDGAVLTALMAGAYGVGLAADKPGLRRTALLGLESYVISSVFSTALKTIVGRSRPLAEEGSLRFRPFSTASRRTSFPSGHTTAAWAAATAVAHGSDSPVIDGLAYSLAALTSLARIQKDKHWASDVFFGAVLGYTTARMICRRNRGDAGPEVHAGAVMMSGRPALSLYLIF